jgi:hypothetical protein
MKVQRLKSDDTQKLLSVQRAHTLARTDKPKR